MSGLRSLAIVAVALALAAAGCGGGEGAESGDTRVPVQDPELVALGEPLYQANCALCHAPDLRGTDKGPSFLSIVYEPNHHGDGAFVLAVLGGVRQHHWPFGDMPPVPGLEEDDLRAIVAFVREQQRIQGFEPYPP